MSLGKSVCCKNILVNIKINKHKDNATLFILLPALFYFFCFNSSIIFALNTHFCYAKRIDIFHQAKWTGQSQNTGRKRVRLPVPTKPRFFRQLLIFLRPPAIISKNIRHLVPKGRKYFITFVIDKRNYPWCSNNVSYVS